MTSDLPAFTAPDKPLDFVPGEVVMWVKPDAVRPEFGTSVQLAEHDAARLPAAVAEPLGYLQRNAGLTSIDPIFSTRGAELSRVRVSRPTRQRLALASSVVDSGADHTAGLTLAHMPARNITSRLVREVNASPAIELFERMPARWLLGDAADPVRNVQWGLRAIRWFDAPRPNANEVIVGVIDSGVDEGHPDLADVTFDYDHRGTRSRDLLGHGTHVAGIVTAAVNNDVGIAGVTSCRVALWKAWPDEPQYRDHFYIDGKQYLRALQAAAGSGASVLNLSFGGTQTSAFEPSLFSQLAAANVLVVAAMGNSRRDGNRVMYPAAHDGVLAVGSIAENREISDFSNTGHHIDLVAPGSNILSTVPLRASRYRPERDYVAWSGTSMAAPHVTAVAAMLAAKHPDWGPRELAQRLVDTAMPLAAMRGSARTDTYGAGLVDAHAALSSD
jgi:hypothetical protein